MSLDFYAHRSHLLMFDMKMKFGGTLFLLLGSTTLSLAHMHLGLPS